MSSRKCLPPILGMCQNLVLMCRHQSSAVESWGAAGPVSRLEDRGARSREQARSLEMEEGRREDGEQGVGSQVTGVRAHEKKGPSRELEFRRRALWIRDGAAGCHEVGLV